MQLYFHSMLPEIHTLIKSHSHKTGGGGEDTPLLQLLDENDENEDYVDYDDEEDG